MCQKCTNGERRKALEKSPVEGEALDQVAGRRRRNSWEEGGRRVALWHDICKGLYP